MNHSPARTIGMSTATARRIEAAIILLCLASLVFIFQPFDKRLSGVGMALVVLAGLAFNLVPLCTPGRPISQLFRAAGIIVLIFGIVLGLALGSAVLYGVYIEAHRGG